MKVRTLWLRLRLYRRDKRLTQKAMAQKVGLQYRNYKYLEEAIHEPLAANILRIRERTSLDLRESDVVNFIDYDLARKILGGGLPDE